MKKVNKFTLDFINQNIKTNTNASSYPVRKPQDIINSSPAIVLSSLTTAIKHNY